MDNQIAKYKARKVKTRLAYYGTLISLFLTFSVFGRGITFSSLVSLLLILPLPAYFLLQSLKLTRKNRQFKTHLAKLESGIWQIEAKFSLGKFLSQPNFAFRLSLALLFLVLFTTLARTRQLDPNPAISYHLESGS